MKLYELKRVLNRAMEVSIPKYDINTTVSELENQPTYQFIYLSSVIEVKATGVMQVTIALD